MTFEYNNALGTAFNYFAYAFAPHLIQKEEEKISIETSVKKDKLHLEVNGKILGRDITIYRNSVSKFFAQLFNKSIGLEINGYHFCVNKKSLDKHFVSSYKDYIINTNNKEVEINYNLYFERNKHNIK